MDGQMTSRERVLLAVSRREPDRVPVSFGDICFSTILDYPPGGYRALCDYLGFTDYADPISAADDLGCVLNVDERLKQRLGADIRTVAPGSSHGFVFSGDGDSIDDWGLVRHRSGPYWELDDAQAPLRKARSIADLDAFRGWPDTKDPAIWEGKREEAAAVRAAGYAVLAAANTGVTIGHNYAFTRGFELYLVDMIERPSFWHALAERLTEWAIAYSAAFLTPIADLVDLVMMADDMGTQSSLFMSPDRYRSFLKPYHRRWTDAIHRIVPSASIVLHSCGSVYSIIPDLIDIGVDVLNPVQPRAANMEPQRLKREFGRDLAFLGGVDIQELLPTGTPAEVRDGTRHLIETLGRGGGFVLAPSHQFQPDVPPENIVAMYDAAREFGWYPLASESQP
jgi:uroporphyrinogen decarboxylase